MRNFNEKLAENKKEMIMIAMIFIGSIVLWSGFKIECVNVINRISSDHVTIKDADGVVRMEYDSGIGARKPYTWDLDEMKEGLYKMAIGATLFGTGYVCATRKVELFKVTRKEAK